MSKNYVRTVNANPLTYWYFYVDREPYEADSVFIDHRLRVGFGDEYEIPDSPYVLVVARVWRWRANEFERCMAELAERLYSPGYVHACVILKTIADRAAGIGG